MRTKQAKKPQAAKFRRTTLEQSFAALRVQGLNAQRQQRLRDCEVKALLKALSLMLAQSGCDGLLSGNRDGTLPNGMQPHRESDQEPLTEAELNDLRSAKWVLIRLARKDARDILATFGDKRVPDESLCIAAADEALKSLGSEGLVPELADTGSEYYSTDRGLVHSDPVNVDDLVEDTRQALGSLLVAVGA